MYGRSKRGKVSRASAYCGTNLDQQSWNEKKGNHVSLPTSRQAKELSPSLVLILYQLKHV